MRYRSVRSGKVLKPNYIFSIYKKGKIREDRINSEITMLKKQDVWFNWLDDFEVHINDIKTWNKEDDFEYKKQE